MSCTITKLNFTETTASEHVRSDRDVAYMWPRAGGTPPSRGRVGVGGRWRLWRHVVVEPKKWVMGSQVDLPDSKAFPIYIFIVIPATMSSSFIVLFSFFSEVLSCNWEYRFLIIFVVRFYVWISPRCTSLYCKAYN